MENKSNTYSSDLFQRINEEKRQRILDISVEEFAQNGFANANVNRIAEKAEISIGSLYKYFKTKDDLYMYIVDEASLIIEESTREILHSDDPVMAKIEQLLRTAHSYSADSPDLIKLYGVLTSDNDEKRAAMIAEKLEGLTSKAYRAMIADAQKNGEVRDDIDAGVLASMIDNQLMVTQFSFANSYYSRRLSLFLGKDKNEYIDIDSLIKEMLGAFEKMLAPKENRDKGVPR